MKTNWIEIQRDNAKKIDKSRVDKVNNNLKALGFDVENNTYTSGRERKEGDEVFYGLIDTNEAYITDDGFEIKPLTLVTLNLDEIGVEYFVDNSRPLTMSGLPTLFKPNKN
jgi:hypothetical protein